MPTDQLIELSNEMVENYDRRPKLSLSSPIWAISDTFSDEAFETRESRHVDVGGMLSPRED